MSHAGHPRASRALVQSSISETAARDLANSNPPGKAVEAWSSVTKNRCLQEGNREKERMVGFGMIRAFDRIQIPLKATVSTRMTT